MIICAGKTGSPAPPAPPRALLGGVREVLDRLHVVLHALPPDTKNEFPDPGKIINTKFNIKNKLTDLCGN